MKLPETSVGKPLGLDDESSYIKAPTKIQKVREWRRTLHSCQVPWVLQTGDRDQLYC